jgi:hypothetical protein
LINPQPAQRQAKPVKVEQQQSTKTADTKTADEKKPAAGAAAAATGEKKEGADGEQPKTGGKDDKAAAESKAPEKYELAIPDGAEQWLDDADLKNFEKTARAKGLTNEQAQAHIDEYADSLATQSAAFREETSKHPKYGGDNLAETQRLATLALDRVRPANTAEGKAIRQLLARTGYGNNVHIVGLLADLGKMMAEDSPAHGTGAGQLKDKSPEAVLYGGSAKT